MPQSSARAQPFRRQPSRPVSSSFPAIPPVVERRSIGQRARVVGGSSFAAAIAVALLIGGGVADAEPIAAKPPSVAATADQLCRLRRGSLAALRHSGVLDTRGDASRELRRRAGAVAERRHGPDADHAGDMGRSASSLRPRRRPLRCARQHHRRRGVSAGAA